MTGDGANTAPPQFSPDGHWWWTGTEWIPADQAPTRQTPAVEPDPEPVAIAVEPDPAPVPAVEPDPTPAIAPSAAASEPATEPAAEPAGSAASELAALAEAAAAWSPPAADRPVETGPAGSGDRPAMDPEWTAPTTAAAESAPTAGDANPGWGAPVGSTAPSASATPSAATWGAPSPEAAAWGAPGDIASWETQPGGGWDAESEGPRPRNRLAVISLLLALLWLFGVGSLLAIVLGVVALRQIRAADGAQGGRGTATAGIAVGVIGLLLAGAAAVLVPDALERRKEQDRVDVRQALRMAAIAQESHFLDAGEYTTSVPVLVEEGYEAEDGVDLEVVRANPSEYCMTASKDGKYVTYLSSTSTGPSTQPC